MASRGGFRSRPITKTIFVKIGDGAETSPPDLVYSIKNALLKCFSTAKKTIRIAPIMLEIKF